MTTLKNAFLACLLSLTFAFPTVHAASVDKVNINTAEMSILDQELAGIGPKKAQAIIDFREKHGPFQTPHDITQVRGIGQKTYERNKDKITVGDLSTAAEVESTATATQAEAATDTGTSVEPIEATQAETN